MAALGFSWADVTATQVYTIFDIQRSERTSALGQCWKACSTAITITVVGSLPSTAKRPFRTGSSLTWARSEHLSLFPC